MQHAFPCLFRSYAAALCMSMTLLCPAAPLIAQSSSAKELVTELLSRGGVEPKADDSPVSERSFRYHPPAASDATDEATTFTPTWNTQDVALAQLQATVFKQQAELISNLQKLQDAYCRDAKLDEALQVRQQIRMLNRLRVTLPNRPSIKKPAAPAIEIPPTVAPELLVNPLHVRSRVGETFYTKVTGTTSGSVWGSNPYTTDSAFSAAAVHAGFVELGETRIVQFRVVPGDEKYAGSTVNGVTSRSWGRYRSGFQIIASARPLPQDRRLNIRSLEKPEAVFVIGQTQGSVWGDGLYTDDSDIATAAVHAGLVQPGQAGIVVVVPAKGQSAYAASSQNGVTTRSYHSWPGSFQLRSSESEPTPAFAAPADSAEGDSADVEQVIDHDE